MGRWSVVIGFGSCSPERVKGVSCELRPNGLLRGSTWSIAATCARWPLHVHPHEDETFIVLEGEILVHVDGSEHRVGPGGIAVVPRGARHAFLVTSDVARILVLQTPGTGEPFYRDASLPSTEEGDAQRPPDWDHLRAAAERNPSCIEILGPPPFEVVGKVRARARAKHSS